MSRNLSDVKKAVIKYINDLNVLKHENLLGCKSAIFVEDEIYLIRDADRKSTSASTINNTTKWRYEAVGKAIACTIEATHYLHENNFPHGHLKSSSIFVNEQNVWKVADHFLVSYLQYLARNTSDCFDLDKRSDLKAIAELIKSFDIQSKKLEELVKACKYAINIDIVKNNPLLEKISNFGRLEAEYEIISYLGSGSFGDVLQVKSYTDNKEYAIKRIKLKTKNRVSEFKKAKREAESLSKLKHNNIVQYQTSWTEIVDESIFDRYRVSSDEPMDVDNNNGRQTVGALYIVMELCAVQNLSSIIEERRLRENSALILNYATQILNGLIYMHSQNVIHSDLKSDNILLSLDGTVIKISDFGLTTTLKSALDGYGSGAGSSIHVAPELLEKNTRNRNIDMYSFGVVLFDMCFGPFTQTNERIALLKKIQKVDSDIPHQCLLDDSYIYFIEAMRALLNEDARKRPQSKEILNYFSNFKF